MARYTERNLAAKRLLLEKGCDTCGSLECCSLDGKEYCGPVPMFEALRRTSAEECEHLPLPKERTCESWVSNDPFGMGFMKAMLPMIRQSYPSMVAKELVVDMGMKPSTETMARGETGITPDSGSGD